MQSVATCLTNRPILASRYGLSPEPGRFDLGPLGTALALPSVDRRRRLSLSLVVGYDVISDQDSIRSYRVQATSYHYRLIDAQEREVLAYHWHPVGLSPITYPHVHLSGRLSPLDAGPGAEPVALGGMHLPTGPVTLADVVRLLITEFGIAPRRADWDAVLAAHQDPFALDR